MKYPLAAGMTMLALLAGCADYNDPQAGPLPSPNPSTALPVPGEGDGNGGDKVTSSADLTIGFGSLGPATVGMSTEEALATGVFRAGNPAAVEGCPEPPLLWKPEFQGVDVLTTEDGAVASLGVSEEGPHTAAGIGVGSTLAELKDAYGNDLTAPAEAGYGQSGAFVSEGDAWIGFLLDPPPASLTDTTEVTFIEVTKGAQPDLMRDGC